jgi:hypothetical protein
MGVVNPDRGGDAAAWRPSRNERQRPHGRPSSAVIVRHKHHRPPLVGRRWKLARPPLPKWFGRAFLCRPGTPTVQVGCPGARASPQRGPSTAEKSDCSLGAGSLARTGAAYEGGPIESTGRATSQWTWVPARSHGPPDARLRRMSFGMLRRAIAAEGAGGMRKSTRTA